MEVTKNNITRVNVELLKKIQEVTIALSNKTIKKSGKCTQKTKDGRSYTAYEYYKLEDFLPSVTKEEKAHGIISFVDFSEDIPQIIVYDLNADQSNPLLNVPFIIKTSIKTPSCFSNGHELTNISTQGITPYAQAYGAFQTYVRKYLYFLLYNIAEEDEIDAIGVARVAPKAKKPYNETREEKSCANIRDYITNFYKNEQITQAKKAINFLKEDGNNLEKLTELLRYLEANMKHQQATKE